VPLQSPLTSRWLKAAVFLVCLIPAVLLYWRWDHHLLGPNWVEKAQHFTGDWILRFLIFTLCVTPLRKVPGLNALIRYRRMLGLFAFFYACVHFAIYLWFDKGLDWKEMWGDFTRRPFYIFGLIAFVLLIPLALTSTAGWIRRLGGRRWQMLHRLIYVSALCGAIHYYLQGKSIVLNAVYTGLFIVFLLLLRVAMLFMRRSPPRTPAPVRL
jgi:methionine sulfoxide reductase heme-binding subunit